MYGFIPTHEQDTPHHQLLVNNAYQKEPCNAFQVFSLPKIYPGVMGSPSYLDTLEEN